MKKLSYELTFLSPAFLGNAEQSGQWRTPPFKALIRQWWRMVFAAGEQAGGELVREMREAERALFGSAADGESQKSLVRLRLDRWDLGKMSSAKGLEKQTIVHPEVTRPVGANLYLGYGPLGYESGGVALKANAAIQAGEQAILKIAVPEEHSERLHSAMGLINRFGAIGGRSRNGWGSLHLRPVAGTEALDSQLSAGILKPWIDAMSHDWPHGIGTESGQPLVWETPARADWQSVMSDLARVKIALRTQFLFKVDAKSGDNPDGRRGISHGQPQPRHWLSYPVTNHPVKRWSNKRLPNSLRFKVTRTQDDALKGVIVHVPCRPPRDFGPQSHADIIESVWRRVHSLLDTLSQPHTERNFDLPQARMERIPGSLRDIQLVRQPR